LRARPRGREGGRTRWIWEAVARERRAASGKREGVFWWAAWKEVRERKGPALAAVAAVVEEGGEEGREGGLPARAVMEREEASMHISMIAGRRAPGRRGGREGRRERGRRRWRSYMCMLQDFISTIMPR